MVGSPMLPLSSVRTINCRTRPGPTMPPPRTAASFPNDPADRSRWPAIVPAIAALGAATFSPPMPLRSTISVVLATRHPSLRSPMMWSWGTRASSMNTSLNNACPVISRKGRTSTPSCFIGNAKYVMPRCLGASGSVRRRDEDSVVGPLPHRRPHLLPGDDPLVTVALGARLQPGQVGTGTRFGEQLAPSVLPVEDLGDEHLDQLR